jgi:hypothetical protein
MSNNSEKFESVKQCIDISPYAHRPWRHNILPNDLHSLRLQKSYAVTIRNYDFPLHTKTVKKINLSWYRTRDDYFLVYLNSVLQWTKGLPSSLPQTSTIKSFRWIIEEVIPIPGLDRFKFLHYHSK